MGARGGRLRFLRTPLGAGVLVSLALLLFLAILAPILWGPASAVTNPLNARQGSSPEHWLGTDDLGRDVLLRTLVATRTSLLLALAAAGTAAVGGFLIGTAAALAPKRLRGLLNGGISWLVAFPPIIVALFVSAILGQGWQGAVLATGVAMVPQFARISQTLSAQVVGADYFAAARVVGVKRGRLLSRYLLPNIAEPVAIQASVTIGQALVVISALSFLGLGVQAPAYDWGRMLADGLNKIYTVPVVALAPATAIVLTGLVFSQLGDLIARAVQPGTGATARKRGAATQRSAEKPAAPRPEGEVLGVSDLQVRFQTPGGTATVVDGVTISLRPGERVGVVGESGSGKTMTSMALAKLLPGDAEASAARLEFRGVDISERIDGPKRKMLGLELAVVFQDPGASLNPLIRVGRQLAEGVRRHRGIGAAEGRRLAVEALADVRIPEPERRSRQHPHEFSGGMRQRAMIAMGLMGGPKVIIADEPTTALDVTVQAQILDLLRDINERNDTAVLLITHDVAVVAEFCERVIVMYGGRIVEDADVETLLKAPVHPYTRALIAAVPDLTVDVSEPLATIPGRPPAAGAIPSGCAFAPRCAFAVDRCREAPPLEPVHAGHRVACWRAEELLRGTAAPTGTGVAS